MKTFINDSKPIQPTENHYGEYGFDRVPILLFEWNRLFQMMLSQSASWLLSKEFNSRDCAIAKIEGGIKIVHHGSMVLGNKSCYFDCCRNSELDAKRNQVAQLITFIVLAWDPYDPINSMISSAAIYCDVNPIDLKNAVDKGIKLSLFNGDPLYNFFSWNPFGEPPRDREYQKFCLIKFHDWSEEKVCQKFEDEDLGKKLLKEINDKIRSVMGKDNWLFAMCCSPKRMNDGSLGFWINTGRTTQIDGWKTQKQIEEFINSDGILIDTATY